MTSRPFTVRKSNADPPRDEWPGIDVTEADVERASGHKLDREPLADRLEAFAAVSERHESAYAGRQHRNHWNFSLVLGDMGSGKSTLVSLMLAHKYAQGVPVFHTGELLFGRRLSVKEIYSAVLRIPNNSAVFIDEAPSYFGIGTDAARNMRLAQQTIFGLRKANCDLYLATAAHDLMTRRMRRECRWVMVPWRPEVDTHHHKRNVRENRLRAFHGLAPVGAAPSGSHRYRLVYDTIGPFPFKENGLLETLGLRDPAEAITEKPIVRRVVPPRWVRLGMLLNDSFRPIAPLAQHTVSIGEIVEEHADYLYGRVQQPEAPQEPTEPKPAATSGPDPTLYPDDRPAWEYALLHLRDGLVDVSALSAQGRVGHVLLSELYSMANCKELGMSRGDLSFVLRQHVGVQPTKNGYKALELLEGIRAGFGEESA